MGKQWAILIVLLFVISINIKTENYFASGSYASILPLGKTNHQVSFTVGNMTEQDPHLYQIPAKRYDIIWLTDYQILNISSDLPVPFLEVYNLELILYNSINDLNNRENQIGKSSLGPKLEFSTYLTIATPIVLYNGYTHYGVLVYDYDVSSKTNFSLNVNLEFLPKQLYELEHSHSKTVSVDKRITHINMINSGENVILERGDEIEIIINPSEYLENNFLILNYELIDTGYMEILRSGEFTTGEPKVIHYKNELQSEMELDLILYYGEIGVNKVQDPMTLLEIKFEKTVSDTIITTTNQETVTLLNQLPIGINHFLFSLLLLVCIRIYGRKYNFPASFIDRSLRN